MSPEHWPLWLVVVVFLAAAAVITLVGIRITRLADRLADATGMGEALFGAIMLGGTTSLPGIVTSVNTAYQGYPALSFSNAVGGIAAQTAFLVFADIIYRHANLEHAAASLENLLQATLLMALLTIPIVAMGSPDITLWGIHPATFMILLAYGFGLRLISQARNYPLWHPYETRQTCQDEPDEAAMGADNQHLWSMWLHFILLAITIAGAGYIISQTGIALSNRTGLSETVVGGLLTSIATSLPELVTVLAAVKQGALTLAVGDIIGGNSFDVLFLALSDISYREGSLYHAVSGQQLFLISINILMTSVLLMGLLRREKRGFANIGFESTLVLVLYGLAGVIMITH